jgi:hypothetical protein
MKIALLAALGGVSAQVATNARLNYHKGNVLQFTQKDDTNPENPTVMMTMDDTCVKITAPCATAENLVVDGVDVKDSLQTLSQSVLDLQSQLNALKSANPVLSANTGACSSLNHGEMRLQTNKVQVCFVNGAQAEWLDLSGAIGVVIPPPNAYPHANALSCMDLYNAGITVSAVYDIAIGKVYCGTSTFPSLPLPPPPSHCTCPTPTLDFRYGHFWWRLDPAAHTPGHEYPVRRLSLPVHPKPQHWQPLDDIALLKKLDWPA